MSAKPEFPENAGALGTTRPTSSKDSGLATGGGRGPMNWRQAAWITVGAVAAYAAMRALPTGTNLHQVDFTVTGKNALELCDPASPQFIPVVAVRSPVTMTVLPQAGGPNRFLVRLATSSGKPIGPLDLMEVHTRKLHLLIVDPTLTDYQHVHPEATGTPGEWSFQFSPKFPAIYRVFADFTPLVTGRSLYANADIKVEPTAPASLTPPTGLPAVAASILGTAAITPSTVECCGDPNPPLSWTQDVAGCHFVLSPSALPVRAGQPVDLSLLITRPDGAPVALEPIMGAFAHVVAFDADRSGFAHLHPNQADPLAPPDPVRPSLPFKLTIPRPGRYVIWAQVRPGGHEVFVPFWFEVAP